jgi:hypothetical protein
MNPGQTFTKTWALKNIGQCQWTTAYQLVFVSGTQMGAPNSAAFPMNVPVGQTAQFSINMTAPMQAGSYRGYWMFKNASGQLFGIGADANKPWWVDIKVSGPTVTPGGPTKTPTPTATGPTPTKVANSAYDFVANACFANWSSGAGGIDCTNQTANAKGYVVQVANAQLENGSSSNQPGLLTVPQNIAGGYIQGVYPPFRVQTGDRFKALVGCQYGANGCYVSFRVYYQIGNGPVYPIGTTSYAEKYEGMNRPVDLDLSSLAGQDVKFILRVTVVNTPSAALAMWVGPYIYRVGASSSAVQSTPVVATTAVGSTPVPATAVPTTAIPSTASTPATPATPATPSTPASYSSAYQNTKYNFKFALPAGATIQTQTDNVGRVSLPIVIPGTNLSEKYILVTATEGKQSCAVTNMAGGTAIVTVNINGVQFSKQTGTEGAVGSVFDWTSYATTRNNACILITFVWHSTNPDNYPNPPAKYDPAQEGAVIDTVMNTFGSAQ